MLKYLGGPPLLEYFDYERNRMVRFKSKHEWNWAHFLEREQLDWEYEPLTFLDEYKTTRGKHMTYTPDFGIQQNTISIEIKTLYERHINNRLELCLNPLILIFGLPSKHTIHVLFPRKPGSHRCVDFNAAYALARYGLPGWMQNAL